MKDINPNVTLSPSDQVVAHLKFLVRTNPVALSSQDL